MVVNHSNIISNQYKCTRAKVGERTHDLNRCNDLLALFGRKSWPQRSLEPENASESSLA